MTVEMVGTLGAIGLVVLLDTTAIVVEWRGHDDDAAVFMGVSVFTLMVTGFTLFVAYCLLSRAGF